MGMVKLQEMSGKWGKISKLTGKKTKIQQKQYLTTSIHWSIYCTIYMFMLSFIFVIVCGLVVWERIGACCLYMHCRLEIHVSRGEGWDPINRFNPVTLLCLSQARTWISNIICLGLILCSVQTRGDCSFCWYWWNWWPSLFKLSFHTIVIPLVFVLISDCSYLNLNTFVRFFFSI